MEAALLEKSEVFSRMKTSPEGLSIAEADSRWAEYLACPGWISIPRTLADINLLISGGIKGMLSR